MNEREAEKKLKDQEMTNKKRSESQKINEQNMLIAEEHRKLKHILKEEDKNFDERRVQY
jgi:hypothetical protein